MVNGTSENGGGDHELVLWPEVVDALLAGHSPLGEDWGRPAAEMDELQRLLRLARVNAFLPNDNAIQEGHTHDATLENYIRLALRAAGDRQTLGAFLDCVQYAMDTSPDEADNLAKQVFWIWRAAADIAGFYKAPLEDTAFSILMPDEYDRLKGEYDRAALEEPGSPLARVREQIELTLAGTLSEGNQVRLEARSKGMYSVWEKTRRKERAVEDIFDLVGLRIVIDHADETQAIADCYRVMAALDAFAREPGRYKDYILDPKRNGYRSIHLSLTSATGLSFEVQIRTQRMHEAVNADTGMSHRANAATFRFTPGIIPRTHRKPSRLYEWRDEAALWMEQHGGQSEGFMGDDILIFRPDGNLYRMAGLVWDGGAAAWVRPTVMDACFRVHTQRALRVRQAFVNGMIVPFSAEISHGDVLHTLDWPKNTVRTIDFGNMYGRVRTADALKAIRKAERQARSPEFWRQRGMEQVVSLLREVSVKQVRKILTDQEREDQTEGIVAFLRSISQQDVLGILTEADKQGLANDMRVRDFDHLLEAIGLGGITGKPGRIANRVREYLGLSSWSEREKPVATRPILTTEQLLAAIVVPSEGGDAPWQIAGCCDGHIRHGEPLVARGGRHDGVLKVHRGEGCPNVRTMEGTLLCAWREL